MRRAGDTIVKTDRRSVGVVGVGGAARTENVFDQKINRPRINQLTQESQPDVESSADDQIFEQLVITD